MCIVCLPVLSTYGLTQTISLNFIDRQLPMSKLWYTTACSVLCALCSVLCILTLSSVPWVMIIVFNRGYQRTHTLPKQSIQRTVVYVHGIGSDPIASDKGSRYDRQIRVGHGLIRSMYQPSSNKHCYVCNNESELGK